MFTGENGVRDEHPGNSLCVSGHEHMGSSYVQSTHIPWLGETFKCFLSNCGYTYHSNYEYDRLENNYRDEYGRTFRPDSVYTVDIRLKRNGKIAIPTVDGSRLTWPHFLLSTALLCLDATSPILGRKLKKYVYTCRFKLVGSMLNSRCLNILCKSQHFKSFFFRL